MMLSDLDLKKLALEQDLIHPFIEENCKGATINLTLDVKVKKYISDKDIVLGEEVTEDQYEEYDISQNPFYLMPGESVLVRTVEYFKIPDYCAGQINERYSIKLLGLMISPASYLNPGYEGRMSFVAYNQSPKRIRLTHDVNFSQLALFRLSSIPEYPYKKQDAKYLGSEDVSISKLHMDKDIQEFLVSKGVGNASNDTAKELGDFLMEKICESAERIADELRAKFGEPNAK